MACAASLRVAARGGPTVHGSARSFEDTGAPFRRRHLFRSSSPSPRDGLDALEARAAFDCNHSSSVTITRGARACRSSSLRSRRLAARLSRRLCTSTSSTRPSWSTARHSQCFSPAILIWDLVQVPLVAGTGQPPADPVREALAELERPLPHGLVADNDAAGGHHLLRHAQAERETEVEPDGVADDLRREPVAGVGGPGRWRHARPVADLPVVRNPPCTNLTVPSRAPRLPYDTGRGKS